MMTREEAQKFLAGEMDVLETMNLGPPEWRAQFREAVAAVAAVEAAPTCACGGEEAIAVKKTVAERRQMWQNPSGTVSVLVASVSFGVVGEREAMPVRIIILEEAAQS